MRIDEYKIDDKFIGKVVKCTTDALKYFTRNELYVVEKIQTRKWSPAKIKVKGINGFFNCSNFEEIPAGLVRDMRINDIFDDNANSEMVTTTKPKIRKFETIDNQEEVLFKLMTKAICGSQPSSWGIQPFDKLVKSLVRGDRFYGLKVEDFELIRGRTLEDILNKKKKKTPII